MVICAGPTSHSSARTSSCSTGSSHRADPRPATRSGIGFCSPGRIRRGTAAHCVIAEAASGVYLESLERARGCEIDRAGFDQSCELGWLSVFCQLGFCLADPLTDSSASADAIARATGTSAEAIDRARRIQERHVR